MTRVSKLLGIRTPHIFGLLLASMWMTPAFGAKLNRYSYFNAHASGTLTPNTTLGADAAFYNPAGCLWSRGLQLPAWKRHNLWRLHGRGDAVVDFGAFNPILPTLSLAWRNNDLAVFGVVFPQAGGLIDVRDDAPVFDESRDFTSTHPTTRRLIPA